ncbi:MAG: methyl-accepting chemotaxis protein [Clostridiaceae bacterium]|nr:methyl-accepting chemotaxis protein [Clostridiaceae bacterium]
MKNLSVSKKLIVGFSIVLGLLLLTIAASVYSINTINQDTQAYSQYTVPNAEYLSDLRLDMEKAKQNVLMAILVDDAANAQKSLDAATVNGQDFVKALELYAGNQRDSSRDADIEQIRTIQAGVVDVRAKIKDMIAVSYQQATEVYVEEYEPALTQITDILDQFSESAKVRNAEQSASATKTMDQAWIILAAAALISILVEVVVIKVITGAILRPVKEIVGVYDEMSKGNMGVQLTYESRDELGVMAKSINKTNTLLSSYIQDISDKLGQMSRGDMRVRMDKDYIGDFAAIKQAMLSTASGLSHILTVIDTAAEQVSTGSSQVASGAQALATGSTEQASSVEELSASITNIAEEAAANSENVRTATQYVEQAHANVQDSAKHMKNLTEAMADIGSASSQITNITKAIEEIAFQTNILALNAAIEAARAGNAGKGFAVVADEVRNLAAKSAEAAKQTAELIQTTVSTVEKGSEVATQTAQILHVVEEKTQQVNDVISRINQASSSQAAAIEQIKVGLNQVSSVVQTNAATAEENSATSEEMSAQAATLRAEVGKFKLDSSAYGGGDIGAISLFEDREEADTEPREVGCGLGKY